VDLATLTGACIIALGLEIGGIAFLYQNPWCSILFSKRIEQHHFSIALGMFTPNDELAKELSESCEKAGEKLWRMPLEEAYWEGMKSSIADMVNTGPRAGGSITAALFLKQVCMYILLAYLRSAIC
jgi:leucyl aminopeptidase